MRKSETGRTVFDELLFRGDESEILKKKADAFDKLASMFYEGNFGQRSESV